MLKKIADAVENYEFDCIQDLVKQAVNQGIKAKEILDNGLLKGMDALGKKFAEGEVFVPEVLMAANTMQAGLDIIREDLKQGGDNSSRGTLIIGTVKGDLHDIGKKLVGMMIEGAGYKVYDLGVDVSVDDFVKAAKEYKADFVGMSAMLTTTMTEMKAVIEALQAEGIKAIPMIGGAPVSEDYAKSIGAKYSHDAASAVDLIKSLS
ncbi:MAG: corrinoid protein [Eubacteriales bacterium]